MNIIISVVNDKNLIFDLFILQKQEIDDLMKPYLNKAMTESYIDVIHDKLLQIKETSEYKRMKSLLQNPK